MIKKSIVEIIDDCYYPDGSLPDCDWSLNEEELVDKLADAIDKEKKEYLEQFVNDCLQICSKIDKDMGLDYVNVVLDIIKLQLKKYLGE